VSGNVVAVAEVMPMVTVSIRCGKVGLPVVVTEIEEKLDEEHAVVSVPDPVAVQPAITSAFTGEALTRKSHTPATEVDPGFGTRGVVGAGAVPSC
jgi:hypothetical protein